jgi:predicted amidohydrolase
MLRIALASPPVAGSIDRAVPLVEEFVAKAVAKKADIVCFPETYVPGLRGQDFSVEPHDPAGLERARDRVCQIAKKHAICVILPMEWGSFEGILNVAFVISATGEVVGCQAKNQLAPEEDPFYVPGRTREMFEVKGIPFGIAICHEGWRYPESVRWAAVRGAKIVFQPAHTGSDKQGRKIASWLASDSPYYEKAIVCRAVENEIYFASVNYGLTYQESATVVVAPDGACLAHAPYGAADLLIAEIDPAAATGLYASRFTPEAYEAPRQ